MKEVAISTEYIRLDALLKLCGEAGTGGQAKMLTQQEQVLVGGRVCTQRGRKLRPGDTVTVGRQVYRIVQNAD